MSGCRISAPAALATTETHCSLIAILPNKKEPSRTSHANQYPIHKENGHACSDVDRVLVLHDGGRDVLARIRTSRSR
jgi:hypothetical protein